MQFGDHDEKHGDQGGGDFYQARTAEELRDSLEAAFINIAAEASSGTAASILSNSEGSQSATDGRMILTVTFADGTEGKWFGELQNLWYYVDPFLGNSTVRENSIDPVDAAANTLYLNLKSDKVVRFYFDMTDTATKVRSTGGCCSWPK